MSTKWLLIAIVLLGFVVRIYRINSVALYGDELTMVYDSYSLLKTGHDSTGKLLPLTFKQGAGRPGGYIYASLPFVAIFGPGYLGERSVSVISGLGIVMLGYFLGKKLFNARVGLFTSLVLAVSPWDIYLSRGGFEAHFALFLATLGVTAFLYSKQKKWLYIIWAISWGLAIHTYPTFKLTLPFVGVLIIWFTRPKLKDSIFLLAIGIIVFFAALSLKETLFGSSEQRFLSINVFSDKNISSSITQKIEFERNHSDIPNFFKPILYNKPIEYARLLVISYANNLDADFLFLQGDKNPRHNPAEMGMLYLIELPLVVYGGYLITREDKIKSLFVFGWILVVPTATMFLNDTHALRNSFMLVPFAIITSYALSKLSKKALILISIFLVVELVIILERVYFLAPNKFAGFWSYPAKMASELTLAKLDQVDNVYLSGSIDNIGYAYEVYTVLDPNLVINQFGATPKIFGKVIIGDTPAFKNLTHGKSLILTGPEEQLPYPDPQKIKSADGLVGFKVYEVSK